MCRQQSGAEGAGYMNKWDRRDKKRERRMRKHGRTIVQIYKNVVLRRKDEDKREQV